MKSKTSFCNKTALKKNITRFAPVWGLYTIFLLLVMFTMANRGEPAILARNTVEAMNIMAFVNLIYGGICAIMLFGDLYNSRMCNALHAFPLRRETWLVTHIFSGVLFSLVPNTLVTVLGCVLMWENGFIAWIWLAVTMLQFLFFFGTGVLSAVCAGNRLAMIAVYGIIQFITLLVYGVASLLYQPLLYGVQLDVSTFFRFFPLAQLVDRRYVEFSYNPVTVEGQFVGFNGDAWFTLGLCAAAGIVSFALACLVYRRRNLESAGDFISLRPLAPVFLSIYTICVGAVFYLVSEVFGNVSYVYLAVGLAVGFFTGHMLLCRTIRVFNKKTILGFVIFAVVLAGSMWVTWLDPFGITAKFPAAEDVEWAAVYSSDQAYNYDQEDQLYRFEITDSAEVKELQEFHARLAADRDVSKEDATCEVRVHYQMKDGSRLIRYYQVDIESALGQEAKKRFSDIRYLFQVNDTENLHELFSLVNIECWDMNMGDKWKFNEEKGTTESVPIIEKDQIEGLIDAINKDCEAGNMVQIYQFHREESQIFSISFSGVNFYSCYIMVYGSCINTINYLQQLDVNS